MFLLMLLYVNAEFGNDLGFRQQFGISATIWNFGNNLGFRKQFGIWDFGN